MVSFWPSKNSEVATLFIKSSLNCGIITTRFSVIVVWQARTNPCFWSLSGSAADALITKFHLWNWTIQSPHVPSPPHVALSGNSAFLMASQIFSPEDTKTEISKGKNVTVCFFIYVSPCPVSPLFVTLLSPYYTQILIRPLSMMCLLCIVWC